MLDNTKFKKMYPRKQGLIQPDLQKRMSKKNQNTETSFLALNESYYNYVDLLTSLVKLIGAGFGSLF